MLDSERAKYQTKQSKEVLQETTPVCRNLKGSVLKLYQASMTYLQGTIVLLGQKVDIITNISYKKSRNLLSVVEKKADDILTKVENTLQIQKSYEDKIIVKNPRDRIIAIIVRSHHIIMLQTQAAIRYSIMVVEEGRKLSINYCLPRYITLKATILITQQMILQHLQSSIQKINASYQASKVIARMLVEGKFTQKNIPNIIQDNIKNIRQIATELVLKGRETKMDTQSLIKIYYALAIRLRVIIDDISQKGASQVARAKEKSLNMYKEVIIRIKEKEIHIKMGYYQQYTSLKLK